MNSVEALTDDNAGKLVLTSLPEPQPNQITCMGLGNEEYKLIAKKARKHGAEGVKLSNKSGEYRFYFKDDKLYSDKSNKDGTTLTQEVKNIDDLPVEAMNPEANRLKLFEKLKAEMPDVSDEDIDAYIDIMFEAQRSMQNLIHTGIDASSAMEIVMNALKDDMSRKLGEVEVEYVSSK
jgi:hypothetical protein